MRRKELPVHVPDPDGESMPKIDSMNEFFVRHVKLDGFTARQ